MQESERSNVEVEVGGLSQMRLSEIDKELGGIMY